MQIFVTITRYKQNEKQTLGKLVIVKENEYSIYQNPYDILFKCDTLELPDKENQKNISRIPFGTYQCRKRWSIRHKRHIEILNVPDRTNILIHAGNFYTDIRGCILVGDELKDINNDGIIDVSNSKKTLKKMLQILPKTFDLRIYD